jgi:hypothetical protein
MRIPSDRYYEFVIELDGEVDVNMVRRRPIGETRGSANDTLCRLQTRNISTANWFNEVSQMMPSVATT